MNDHHAIQSSTEGIYILIYSIVITLIIVLFQHYVMRRAKSNVIKADSLHYITDFLTNICAIIGIIIATNWNFPLFDNLTASAIAIYIIFIAFGMFKKAFNNLMDHEMDENDRQKIISILNYNKNILGFHDLKTRYAGVKPFIQFHLEMDGNLSLLEAHNISDQIATELMKHFPKAEIIIHQDPV